MDPVTAFFAVVSLCATAWEAYSSLAQQNHSSSSESSIKQDLSQIMSEFSAIKEQIDKVVVDIMNGIIAMQLITVVTDLNGRFLGLKDRFSEYPISGTSSDEQKKYLMDIISDSEDLRGSLVSWMEEAIAMGSPFRYTCTLFIIYSSNICLLLTAIQECASRFGVYYDDTDELTELQAYSNTFLDRVNNILNNSFLGYYMKEHEDIEEEVPRPGGKGSIIYYDYLIDAWYDKKLLNPDYVYTETLEAKQNDLVKSHYLYGQRPTRQEIDAKKNPLRNKISKMIKDDINNTKQKDPILNLAQSDSNIVHNSTNLKARAFKSLKIESWFVPQ